MTLKTEVYYMFARQEVQRSSPTEISPVYMNAMLIEVSSK